MPDERALAFPCHDAWLYGVLSLPPLPQRRGVLIVVGGPQYRVGSHRQFTLLARSLAAAGIPTMRFDYRGMGDSEGAMRDFECVGDDIRAAIDSFIAQSPGLQEVALWGLCDGASAAAMYAPQDARVAGLVLLNPWVRTDAGVAKATIKHYYGARLLDRGFWVKLLRGRFGFAAGLRSLMHMTRTAYGGQPEAATSLPDRMHAALSRFTGKVLVILSGADLTAQEFRDLMGSAKWTDLVSAERFTRHILPKADHTCSRREWHEQAVSCTRDWLRAW